MIIAFSGWRDWTDREFVNQLVDGVVNGDLILLPKSNNPWLLTMIRVGDCPTGVDEMVRTRLEELGLPYQCYQARWDLHGRAAGPIRNRNMLKGEGNECVGDSGGLVDLLIALPNRTSHPHHGSGTWDCIGAAWSLGVDVFLPKYKEGE